MFHSLKQDIDSTCPANWVGLGGFSVPVLLAIQILDIIQSPGFIERTLFPLTSISLSSLMTTHTQGLGMNKIQAEEILNGMLWEAVRYLETRRRNCALVGLCTYKRTRKQQDTGGESFLLAACCVLRYSAHCLPLRLQGDITSRSFSLRK